MTSERSQAHFDEFHRVVNLCFQFLVERYGFTIRDCGDYQMSAINKYCVVQFFLERECIVTAFGKMPRWWRRYDPRQEVGLAAIIPCLDPMANMDFFRFRPRFILTSELEGEARTTAGLIVDYCEPFLRGDFSPWPTKEQVDQAIRTCYPTGQTR